MLSNIVKGKDRDRDRQGSAAHKAQSGKQRAESPTTSIRSNQSTLGPTHSNGIGDRSAPKKHGILSKFRRHKKDEGSGILKSLPGSVRSLVNGGQHPRADDNKPAWDQNESFAAFANTDLLVPVPKTDGAATSRPSPPRQGTFTKLPFTRKGRGSKQTEEEDPVYDHDQTNIQGTATKFNLDKDLSNMEGILSQPQPMQPLDNSIFSGIVDDEAKQESADGSTGGLGWNAPDSWAVKKVDEVNMSRLLEIDETGIPPQAGSKAHPYCIRIFKSDGTFATLSVPLNSTVGDVMLQTARKNHITESLDNYQIVLKKHELRRILGPGERPVVIQKRLLEQAGYEEKDDIEDLGREDQSYLCRFVFVAQRDTGYAATPSFSKMQKTSHVDLSGKNLVTIPIALYSKATEIVSLDLSRNLSLDLPKDFIQSCVNLREIRFVNNEAWHLPQSLSRAAKLMHLDVSNNRLEQLEHAELNRLANLHSLKLANNRLTHLPPYFNVFQSLRMLNVSSNYLEELPEFLCELTGLVDLDLSFNSISSLPDAIGNLVNLDRLCITNNALQKTLPDTFSQLTKLKEVDIRYNALTSIDVIADLPLVESISADHNAVSVFEGTFENIKVLRLNSNPVTKFEILNKTLSLKRLNLSNAKLAHIPDASFDKMPNLEELVLDKNHFVSLPSHIGKLQKLEKFSIARNILSSLPPEIGCLRALKFFNISRNNLKKLPSEIWWAKSLETLNISSNVLTDFPKPGSRAPQIPGDILNDRSASFSTAATPSLSKTASYEEVGPLEAFGQRRPSQAPGQLLAVGPPPPGGERKNSIVSIYGKGGRQASVVSRTASSSTHESPTPPASTRKDSTVSERLAETFARSLKNLYLADNQLEDDVYEELTLLAELKVLNLSYNDLNDLPQRTLRSWPQLQELYLSGNDLSSLPAEDIDDSSMLQVLHINGNKFQTLPAELGKAHRLAVLDVGSNSLKYNVSNWPYDWNWNCNPNLKYLNLSGNKRLNIKPNGEYGGPGRFDDRDAKASTDFNSLTSLRILGLMDVTLTIPNIPDETEDRRVRTSGTLAGAMAYGMADTLGKNDHLSIIDMVVPRFSSNESETLVGMFDGQSLTSGGSKIAKYLRENFGRIFVEELKLLNPALHDSPADALRRAFLSLNKDLTTTAAQHPDENHGMISRRGGSIASPALTEADLKFGSVATVVFIEQMELYVANVGNAQAMLIQAEGGHRILTRKHDPADQYERQRIRNAGGWVSRTGRLNDTLNVSRAFGYVHLMPAVQAAPHITQITMREQDEMILLASSELWEYLSPDLVVDVARSERTDLVRAAQKLRDLAMAFGATGKIMVMIIGVSDLKKRERIRLNRGSSMTAGPMGVLDDVYLPTNKRGKRAKEAVEDSMLRRLEAEVPAPVGEISIVFTDIKGSTQLWETNQAAMRSAIKLHNEIMRRQLRIIGGYEVKTEGDAFMVSFPTATSALLWCFSVQAQLLDVQWPSEILNHPAGKEVYDQDNNLIFRGLSVRMGIHFGNPVCEKDTVTRRMDYFGPMVNKTSRISSTADGGQITVSADFISEIQRCLETYSESDRNGSTGSEEQYGDDVISQSIRRELRSLSSQGFEVKPMGERKLKGLENPEYIYLMYPHALAGRIAYQPILGCDLGDADAKAKEKEKRKADDLAKEGQNDMETDNRVALTVDPDAIWTLWRLSLRLEALCDGLEDGIAREVTTSQVEMIEKIGPRGSDITDELLLGFMRNMVIRIEVSYTTSLSVMIMLTAAIGVCVKHLNQASGHGRARSGPAAEHP